MIVALSVTGSTVSTLICIIGCILCACKLQYASHESRASRRQGSQLSRTSQSRQVYCLTVATPRNTHEDANSPLQPPAPPYACPYYAAQETQVDYNVDISEDNPPAYHTVIPSNSKSVTRKMVLQPTPPTDRAFSLPIPTKTVPTSASPQQSDSA